MANDFQLSKADLAYKLNAIAIEVLDQAQAEYSYDQQVYLDTMHFIQHTVNKLLKTAKLSNAATDDVVLSRTEYDKMQHQALAIGKIAENFANKLQEKNDHVQIYKEQEKEINTREMLDASTQADYQNKNFIYDPLLDTNDLNATLYDDWRHKLVVPKVLEGEADNKSGKNANSPSKEPPPLPPSRAKSTLPKWTDAPPPPPLKKKAKKDNPSFLQKTTHIITKPFKDAMQLGKKTVENTTKAITGAAKATTKAITGAAKATTKAITGAAKATTQAVTGAAKATTKVITGAAKATTKAITGGVKATKKVVSNTIASTKKMAVKTNTATKKMISNTKKKMSSAKKKMKKAFKKK